MTLGHRHTHRSGGTNPYPQNDQNNGATPTAAPSSDKRFSPSIATDSREKADEKAGDSKGHRETSSSMDILSFPITLRDHPG